MIDRIGRIYIQEISDNPDGPRCVLYRGELGRRAGSPAGQPRQDGWQFTPETVHHIETMFRGVLGRPPDESQKDDALLLAATSFWEMPGPWLRLQLPGWTEVRLGRLDLYQWLGLGLAVLASWIGGRLTMVVVSWLVTWVLRRSGSALSISFVAATLRPCTWLAAVWIFFLLLGVLDLPVAVAGEVFAAKKFLLAGLFAWVCMRLMDLTMGIYTNSELLRPHRNLGDMIVPVAMRLGKTTVVLVVAAYMIYQVGEVDLLGRFLTGLGVAGLAASLAAQDVLKSFFGTLLLIGERVFRIGDRIRVGDPEGVVEQVGFRSTRLRTDEGTLLTVPNSVIAASAINNLGALRASPLQYHHRGEPRNGGGTNSGSPRPPAGLAVRAVAGHPRQGGLPGPPHRQPRRGAAAEPFPGHPGRGRGNAAFAQPSAGRLCGWRGSWK